MTLPECNLKIQNISTLPDATLTGDAGDRKNCTGILHGFKRSKLKPQEEL